MPDNIALIFAPDGQGLDEPLLAWLEDHRLSARATCDPDEVMRASLRARPRLVLADARQHPVMASAMCRRLKLDSYTGIVPVILLARDDEASFAAAFEAGADEVLREGCHPQEVRLRLNAMLRRSDRDTVVHPSTRLPGTIEIELEMTRRILAKERFAVCYADLDHFKEYNDRYSYSDGDRVIRIVSLILHDCVRGLCGEDGFVGHIGGDDFICILPIANIMETCGTVLEVFDVLIPLQYSEQDRRAGYFFGKDRRGQLHRVKLMTLSLGVVTNERREFQHAGQLSALVTEMKGYAKSLDGSVFAVDRRIAAVPGASPVQNQRSARLGEG